ncbi:uncharacterized protein SAPINGB_P002418 [Magnusiomyces paraingens]|uniref:ATP-dependent DNA helicase PIF1 n=1 Tax=Magnusiomyces paraingens TaxID=2606893 RepID=A0A5E8BJL0_9ASCO|nr:uncharacterized protein SAPINGB_P002418 [Saprochaete ingens]VVT49737.1 unnamed protein product [Saprochaete ingens]
MSSQPNGNPNGYQKNVLKKNSYQSTLNFQSRPPKNGHLSSKIHKTEPTDDSSDDDLVEISYSKTPHPNNQAKSNYNYNPPIVKQQVHQTTFKSPSNSQPKRKLSFPESFNQIDQFSNDEFLQPKSSQTIHSPAHKNVDKSIRLSKEQQLVIDIALQGYSLFYTGAAGTGKSLLLRSLIARLESMNKSVAVTSSTGMAAVNIGGITLHSFAGVGLAKEDAKELLKKIRKNDATCQRWKSTSILVIDEVSMVDAALFTKLEYIARSIRKDQNPFGGIQVICTGDFFQLPPVPDKYMPENGNAFISKPRVYCFESEAWRQTIKRCIVLQQVFRQKGDDEFIEILNSMRLGQLTDKMNARLKSLDRPVAYKDGILPTMLYATRNRVQQYNFKQLAELSGKRYVYLSADSMPYYVPPGKAAQINKQLDEIVGKQIELRKNCQVMLIRNINDSRLANGILGRIIGFLTEDGFEKVCSEAVKRDINKTSLQFQQLVHNYQAEEETKYNKGNSEIRVQCTKVVDKKDPLPVIDFSLDTLGSTHLIYHLKPFEASINIGGKPGKSDDNFRTIEDNPTSDPSELDFEEDKEHLKASRIQVPLIYAWAMSIHKSQGQTLPRVRVDLANIFENGHAYVAISRATSTKSLEVLNYNPTKVTVDPKVVAFYRKLESVAAKISPEEEKQHRIQQEKLELEQKEQQEKHEEQIKRRKLEYFQKKKEHEDLIRKQREKMRNMHVMEKKQNSIPTTQYQVVDIDSDSSVEILD